MPWAHTTLMGGAACMPSGVLYHRTDPPPPPRLCIGRAALSLGQPGQVEAAGGRPFAGQGRLYSTPAALFVHQPGNWTFVVQDDQLSGCGTEKVSTRRLEVQVAGVAFVGVTRVAWSPQGLAVR